MQIPHHFIASQITHLMAFQSGSPWETTTDRLAQSISGPIAKGVAIIGVVIGGLTFAYGEGQHKKQIGQLVIGLSMALGAASFLSAYIF